MIYITGDRHGNFKDIDRFCSRFKTAKEDLLIVLGDAGINYFLDERDYLLKCRLSAMPITFFCIHGNHEERPENIEGYKEREFMGGSVYYEEEFPDILFAIDGEVYELNGRSVLVIGGAYSVDKAYRLKIGQRWFESEQPDDKTKEKVKKVLKQRKQQVDVILSHTCPYKYIPREMFLSCVDQSSVDCSTERFLDEIEEENAYQKWYCGHYHTDKSIDRLRFLYSTIEEF